MHPLNHVVTYVHWVNVGWHHFDTECILISDRSERLIPPACTFDQRRTNRLRCSSINVIDNWLYRFTNCRIRIFLLQTMSRDETFRDRLLNWRRKIHVVNAGIAGPRIKHSRLETWTGQLHERVPLADRDRLGSGHNLPDKLARWFTRER